MDTTLVLVLLCASLNSIVGQDCPPLLTAFHGNLWPDPTNPQHYAVSVRCKKGCSGNENTACNQITIDTLPVGRSLGDSMIQQLEQNLRNFGLFTESPATVLAWTSFYNYRFISSTAQIQAGQSIASGVATDPNNTIASCGNLTAPTFGPIKINFMPNDGVDMVSIKLELGMQDMVINPAVSHSFPHAWRTFNFDAISCTADDSIGGKVIGNIEYRAFSTAKNYTHSRKACRDLNTKADLFLPLTKTRAEEVVAAFPELFPNNAAPPIWLAANAREPTFLSYFHNNTVTVDGYQVGGYRNYSLGQPSDAHNNNTEESCLSFRTNTKWDDVPCSDTYPYICQLPLTEFKNRLLVSEYHFACEKKTYSDAQAYCHDMGSNLITINSEAEHLHVLQMSQKYYYNANASCPSSSSYMAYWIYNNDIQEYDKKIFRGSNNETAWAGNWDSSEPSGLDGDDNPEKCVEVKLTSTPPGKWNDIKCSSGSTGKTMGFGCERIVASAVQEIEKPDSQDKFWLINHFGTRHESQEFCQRMGGDLISIRTEADHNFLVSQALTAMSLFNGSVLEIDNGFWTYTNDIVTETNIPAAFIRKTIRTSAQSPDDEVIGGSGFSFFTNRGLASGDSISTGLSDNDLDCVMVNLVAGNDNKWLIRKCGESHTLTTGIRADTRTLSICEFQAKCPGKSMRVGAEKCYNVITGQTGSWEDGQGYCERLGDAGRLAAFRHIDEWTEFTQHILVLLASGVTPLPWDKTKVYWTAGFAYDCWASTVINSTLYRWSQRNVVSAPITTFIPIADLPWDYGGGEPSVLGCMVAGSNSTYHIWGTQPCNSVNPFICEFDLISTVAVSGSDV